MLNCYYSTAIDILVSESELALLSGVSNMVIHMCIFVMLLKHLES